MRELRSDDILFEPYLLQYFEYFFDQLIIRQLPIEYYSSIRFINFFFCLRIQSIAVLRLFRKGRIVAILTKEDSN